MYDKFAQEFALQRMTTWANSWFAFMKYLNGCTFTLRIISILLKIQDMNYQKHPNLDNMKLNLGKTNLKDLVVFKRSHVGNILVRFS